MERLRMCICCRKHLDKKELIRVVKNKNGEFFIDRTFKADGRGAYVCKNSECLLKLKKQRGFNKAFKCEVPKEIYDELEGEACD